MHLDVADDTIGDREVLGGDARRDARREPGSYRHLRTADERRRSGIDVCNGSRGHTVRVPGARGRPRPSRLLKGSHRIFPYFSLVIFPDSISMQFDDGLPNITRSPPPPQPARVCVVSTPVAWASRIRFAGARPREVVGCALLVK